MSKPSSAASLNLEKLFRPPYCELIRLGLPELFRQEQLKHTRGGRTGMEVGNARERVIISLCMFVFGEDNLELPGTTASEVDLYIYGYGISIKTKTGETNSGIKLKWTTDWEMVQEIQRNYKPSCDLILVKIVWGGKSSFYWIPRLVQDEVLQELGTKAYIKLPPRETNPRGVEFSAAAIKSMLENSATKNLMIEWGEPSRAAEQQVYADYLAKWHQLAQRYNGL